VLVKGGHRSGPDATDLLYDGNRTYEFTAPRHATEHTHGSGDTLAAAICAALARGSDMPEAVRLGKAYVTQAITNSYPLGSGLGPVGHFWRIRDWPPANS
jgi:hydroxymethylpyrimidine/phosphomethylpyrimidine kinase